MASIRKNKLDSGISYTIRVKVKDPKTNKVITRCKTWKKPPDMTEYQAKRELEKLSFNFDEEIRRKFKGLLANGEEQTFMDFANDWLKRIKKDKSPTYYVRIASQMKTFQDFFGEIKLKEISPSIIQKFIDELSEHNVVHEYATLKNGKREDLSTAFKVLRIKLTELQSKIGVGKHMYTAALRGEHIKPNVAMKLCNAFNIKFNDYFDITHQEHPYAKDSIMKYKITLSAILASAKRQRLVEHNFASSDYILPITGKKKDIEILNDVDAQKLKAALDKETNQRWKISLYIILFMGLRRGELAGLEWKDIDFENKTMTIERSSYHISGNGIITKDPKTFTSKRCLTMPDTLITALKAYKVWYDKRKAIFGDLWENTDRVLCTDMGQIIQPGMYRVWLQKICKREGLPMVTLHSLRHTNITLQLISGVDLKTVSVRAGHARASTTSDIYSHFIKSSDSHASQIIDDIFKNKEEH